MILEYYITLQNEWELKTFGPGQHVEMIIKHIRKELNEILEDPNDITEWIDVIILAIAGATRQGYNPREITQALEDKLKVNILRSWPDWKTANTLEPIEHIKGE